MKSKIFGGIAIVAIAGAMAFNVTMSNQKQNQASLLALANVEALAQTGGEFGGGSSGGHGATSCWGSFTFDGKTYDCDSHWYNVIGKHWCPEVRTCTKTEGIDMGYVNLDTYQGQKVVCTSGDGNCLQNTPCI